MWSSEAESGNTPWRLTRPHVGLRPVSPQAADGKRIEPPVSDPSAPKQKPAATATPDPLDETPVQWPGCQGFAGAVRPGWCSPVAPSVSMVLPTITAPAASSFSTTVASKSGSKSAITVVPDAVTMPFVKQRSLIPIGIPWSGPRHFPRAISASAFSACRRALSRSCTANAWSSGSIRASAASNSCVDCSSPRRNASAASTRLIQQGSVVMRPWYHGSAERVKPAGSDAPA